MTAKQANFYMILGREVYHKTDENKLYSLLGRGNIVIQYDTKTGKIGHCKVNDFLKTPDGWRTFDRLPLRGSDILKALEYGYLIKRKKGKNKYQLVSDGIRNRHKRAYTLKIIDENDNVKSKSPWLNAVTLYETEWVIIDE